jgi:hypothetical protein
LPNRILREGILTSPRIAKLGWAEEVFYRRMHSIVDDFGRYFADVGLLRAACYPRQLNKVSDSDVGKWLHACVAAALVRVYQVDGEGYLLLLDFNQQVRAKKSRFPDMPSTCAADATQTPANAHLDVSVSVSEDVVGTADADKPSRKKPKTALPEDFAPDETGVRLCEEAGFVVTDEAAKFRNHHTAQGTLMANWQAGFRTWIDKAKGFRRPAPGMSQTGSNTVPLNPKNLYKPEPTLTPEQIAVNKANAERSLAALKEKGIAGIRSAAA